MQCKLMNIEDTGMYELAVSDMQLVVFLKGRLKEQVWFLKSNCEIDNDKYSLFRRRIDKMHEAKEPHVHRATTPALRRR